MTAFYLAWQSRRDTFCIRTYIDKTQRISNDTIILTLVQFLFLVKHTLPNAVLINLQYFVC